MRPRKPENRHLPMNMYQRTRKRKNGKVWISYYYLDPNKHEISLGGDLVAAKLKWAELEAKSAPI